MVYFHGIDVYAKTMSVTFDYEKADEEEVIKFVKEKLGSRVSINELSTFIEELQEEL